MPLSTTQQIELGAWEEEFARKSRAAGNDQWAMVPLLAALMRYIHDERITTADLDEMAPMEGVMMPKYPMSFLASIWVETPEAAMKGTAAEAVVAEFQKLPPRSVPN